jgi:soluble cytochrome b562
MSIEAMKQALDALDSDNPDIQLRAAQALRTAIAEAEKQEKQELTHEQIDSACLSYRHDFGLLSVAEQDEIRFQATEWDIALAKARSE